MSVCRLILLGAGKPFRGSTPSAAHQISSHQNNTVLDWLLGAFQAENIDFVAGYNAEKIEKLYPKIPIFINPDWQQTGSVYSLFCAPFQECETIVCYTDIVVRYNAAQLVSKSKTDVTIAVDFSWEQQTGTDGKYCPLAELISVDGREVEFAGIIKLSKRAISMLIDNADTLQNDFRTDHLVSLANWFLEQSQSEDLSVSFVDIAGEWTELNLPGDLAKFVLGTKSETLDRLSGVLNKSRICEQVSFDLKHWLDDQSQCIEKIGNLDAQSVIVRSSTFMEDSWESSKAGMFESVNDVDPCDHRKLIDAVDNVVRSYGEQADDNNQILVQPFLKNVAISGVVFTRTLEHLAPYYVINYDNNSGTTDTVTSGGKASLSTLTLLRDQETPKHLDRELFSLMDAIKEIESVLRYDALDIEFAIAKNGEVFILQVRPLQAPAEHVLWDYQEVYAAAKKACQKFEQIAAQYNENLDSDKLILGVMPDWNPAEIIGVKPRKLARSIYEKLVMDSTWANQRAEYGYCDLRGVKLLHQIAGHAYVHVTASLNSFIPDNLPKTLKQKLLNYYLERLTANPHFHDKIEFEVAVTSLDFVFDDHAMQMLEAGLNESEIDLIKSALAEITQSAFSRYKSDIAEIYALEQKKLPEEPEQLSIADITSVLEDCRDKGVLPFAHMARSAFVAFSIMQSALKKAIISNAQFESYFSKLRTIPSMLLEDALATKQGAMEWADFVARYGHLRSGSYNILSAPYIRNPEFYLRPIVERSSPHTMEELQTTSDEIDWNDLAKHCGAIGLEIDGSSLRDFVTTCIEGREYAKFVFMRQLNHALVQIEQWGGACGLTAEELSYLSLRELSNLSDDMLAEQANSNKRQYEINLAVQLPALLCDGGEILAFKTSALQPNFIGSSEVIAESAVLLDARADKVDLDGKIVMIEQADPGWDWIFGHNIVGLVTAWGGANSHMSIRAAEFNLPAAIGVGEDVWQKLSRQRKLRLNCATQQLEGFL